MKAIAISGSPRKKWNTAQLLEKVLEGAASKGAETRLVHLYDLDFKGCLSCFECKKVGGKSYGRCAVKDDLHPILDEIAQADVLVLGTPVYFGKESGEMRSFMERLFFPYISYAANYQILFPGKLASALIYTMNVTEEQMRSLYLEGVIRFSESYMKRIFGSCETLIATDTLQFSDYSAYVASRWDPVAKAKRHAEVFPQDLAAAFDLGVRLALSPKA